jgi:Rps23 Pro-64 3,4-dihydroxylase Tpa1-like proline 4-hydroxylase
VIKKSSKRLNFADYSVQFQSSFDMPLSVADVQVFDYEKWTLRLPMLKAQYASARPFAHVVLDDFISADIAKEAHDRFPKPDSGEWIQYKHINEKKLGKRDRTAIPDIHLAIIDTFNSRRFVEWLSELTGISRLIADPSLEGGGLHQIERGGFLNIHADFTAHQHQKHWARRVNVLLYLNENWTDDYGGHLELWSKDMSRCEQKILPIFNRCVIFNTDSDSYHGHPHPLTAPEDETRKSIALYFFTEETSAPKARATDYRPLPNDSLGKRFAIFFDNLALRAYDFLKRRLGFDDKLVSKILKSLSK